MGRVEVITRGERRRMWTTEQKREIVLESLDPSMRPSDVARRHGINTGLLYTWRRQMVDGQLGELVRAAPSFVRVDVAPPAPVLQVPAEPSSEAAQPPEMPPLAVPPRASLGGLIEIVLAGGITLRVDAQVDGRALRRVLGVLEGR